MLLLLLLLLLLLFYKFDFLKNRSTLWFELKYLIILIFKLNLYFLFYIFIGLKELKTCLV